MSYSLTLRGDKGERLTIEEMDNNLLYLQNLGTASSPSLYTKYVALLTQTSTASPTAIELENTIGISPIFTRNQTGNYLLSWVGASPSLVTLDKMWVTGCPISMTSSVSLVANDVDSEVSIYTKSGVIFTDDLLSNYSIEIRIYS